MWIPESRDGTYTKPMRCGQTTLTAKFSNALTTGSTVIVYGSFDGLMKIYYSKNVTVET